VAEHISGWLDEGCDVFGYFNNDYRGDAVADAGSLSSRIRSLSGSSLRAT
jgi:hypothetical protein